MKWLKDYFDLSKKEEAGFIALFCIIIILFLAQFFIIYFVPATKTDFTDLQRVAKQLESAKMDSVQMDSEKNIIPIGPKKTLTVPVDLNTADSVKLMTVKGIGPTFAGRILAMRRRLGCFVDIAQLMDVHGIRTEKYGYLKPQVCLSKGQPKYENINTETVDGLMMNPYLSYQLANSIIHYRTSHGRFHSTDELKKALIMDDDLFRKLKCYIKI